MRNKIAVCDYSRITALVQQLATALVVSVEDGADRVSRALELYQREFADHLAEEVEAAAEVLRSANVEFSP